ncbi:MAG: hypothetical protein KIT44_06580 [Opitutaceae bacterium]|nr:hypothetical protein [Opitutaceae bacterium]
MNGAACTVNRTLHRLGCLLVAEADEQAAVIEIARDSGKAPAEAARQRAIRMISRTNRLIARLPQLEASLVAEQKTVRRLRSISGNWSIVGLK